MKLFVFFKKLILNLVFIPIFYIFSYIVPKNGNLILLGANLGNNFIGNTKYFYLYLKRKNVSFRYFWITNSKKVYNSLFDKNYPVVYLYSLRALWFILRARLLIVEQSSKDITGRTLLIGSYKIINTWHGVPLKRLFFDKKHRSKFEEVFYRLMVNELKIYNFIISTSSCVSKTLESAFLNTNIKIVGFPKNDIFFNKNIKSNDYKKELEVDKYEKIFLYAPTYRDKSCIKPFSKKGIEKLGKYMKKNNCLFLLKSHPNVLTKFKNYYRSDNIREISPTLDDIQEILIYIDVLITDYSSVMFDFSLTKKPIIFYPFDYKEYSQCPGFYYNYYRDLPGPFAKNEEELFFLLKTINRWSEKERYKEKYRNFRNKFNFYQDGKSSERLFKIIKGMIDYDSK